MGSLVGDALGVFGIEAGSAKAARQAGEAQQQAANQGIAEQRRQFDITQQQSEPLRQAELDALQQREPLRQEATAQMAALSGLGGVDAQRAAFQGLQTSPDQQFLQQRQEQALLRNQAAIGGLGCGNVRTALQQQAVGFGQQDLQNQLARLSGFTGAQGSGTTRSLGAGRANLASNVGNLLNTAGQAQASGILGAQQAQDQFGGQIGSILSGGIGGALSPKSSFGQGAAAGLLGLF